MTSPYARPDQPALAELERLLALVEEELAHGKSKGGHHVGAELQQARQKIGFLEGENQALRQRIAAAREQIERLRTRLRFVEEHGEGSAA